MPITLADTSSLIALTQLRKLDLLNYLYDVVTITGEVRAEYSRKHGDLLPDWIVVASAKNRADQQALEEYLDPGEASLIQLARELPESLLILDELKARRVAKNEGLHITGTIGVLIEAKSRGLIQEIRPLLEERRETNFRFSDRLVKKALALCGELPLI
jgi:predicted nucleic acid-binding protein